MEGFLLVDDRDGRVLVELEDVESALLAFDAVQSEDPDLAEALCIVRFGARDGALVGTRSTTRVRPLT